MHDRNLVVSGNRLAAAFAAAAAAREAPTDAATLGDAAAFVGAAEDDFQLDGMRAPSSAARTQRAPTRAPDGLAAESLEMQLSAAVEMLADADLTPGVFATTENRFAALLQSALAERAAESGRAEPAEGDSREAKFDEHDLRWVLSLFTWIGRLKPHAWQPPPARADQFDKDLKLALVGDWGTGLYGAPQCAASINALGGFDYIVHLGDIYYSGTKNETRANFLRQWPRVAGARNRACNGNHEMYSGGYGYYDVLLPHFEQPSSCFAIQNAHWLVVGLDSAYDDHDLANHQDAWLKRLVDAASSRRVVLLTHHQPFSHLDGGGDKLIEKLRPLLTSQRITAWYWGHEHRCLIYERHPRWNFFGRCIGHSGYPYFRRPSLEFNRINDPPSVGNAFWRELPANGRTGTPRALLLDGPNPDLGHQADVYGPNGFLTLEFAGPKLIERYHLANGTLLTTCTVAT